MRNFLVTWKNSDISGKAKSLGSSYPERKYCFSRPSGQNIAVSDHNSQVKTGAKVTGDDEKVEEKIITPTKQKDKPFQGEDED